MDTVIQSALGELRNLPTPVGGWQVETGLDATDDPAVWVWAALEDEEAGIDARNRLRWVVRDAVRRVTGDERWVYVRIRTVSDP